MIKQITDTERALSAQIDEQGGQLAAWRDRAIAAEARVAALVLALEYHRDQTRPIVRTELVLSAARAAMKGTP